MEPQTHQNFIPENAKPKITNIPKWQNLLLVFSVITFLASILGGVGFYLVRVGTKSSNTSYEQSIIRAKERFDAGLPVKTLEQFDMRLRAANDILKKHKAFDQFFGILEKITLKNVQFTSFSFKEGDGGKKGEIKLTGVGPDYKTVAEQSEQFSNDPDARRYFTDIIFSNLNVDKTNKGVVNFDVTFGVDPELLLYSKQIGMSNVKIN